MRILILFIFLLTNSYADGISGLKNIVVNKELKKYDSLVFLDEKNKELSLKNYRGNLILLNFWASWCAPCKEEMPSLDQLQSNKDLKNLKIFPINVGQDDIQKASKFFEDLEIKNLQLYFDSPITLAKKFELRGIPTSILINKDGFEFARIYGSINFNDKKFIDWLSNYN
ncbi:TlpA family protein disulfide reductase [Pelagibacterales bacterium SAG-MED13]|nr:TlpA family protein disulfide reductase [Pelagibacterales bacterium SAG-MED13]|tara:strand:+ start:491 stop:1000 length:510 start_codon:yes stop_codon:yes gene_type:complete